VQSSTTPKAAPPVASTAQSYTDIEEFYHPAVPEEVGSKPKAVDPQYVQCSIAERQALVQSYLRKGYHQVGYDEYSTLPGPFGQYTGPSRREILDQARRVGADVAIFGAYPGGQETITVPVSQGFNNGYQMVPTQVTRTAYFVEFLALSSTKQEEGHS
jgi:hypothetical protein